MSAEKGKDFLMQRAEELKIREVDWSRYLEPGEESKIRDASTYHEQVRQSFLSPETADGLKLPWRKADQFHFRSGEMTIWTGYSGHKKSMILGQVMLSIMAQASVVCISSLEMKPHKSLKRMAHQFTGSGEPTMPMLDDMFDWFAGKLWFYDQVGTIDPKRMIAVSRYAITELGVEHMVIDSLMKCGIDEDDYNKQKWFVDELHTLAKDTDAHIHLVSHQKKPHDSREHEPGEKYGVHGSANITNQPENVLVVYWNKKKDELRLKGEWVDESDPDAYLICKKQREGEAEPLYKLWFDSPSLQFKSEYTSPRLGYSDWIANRWQ